MKIQIEDYLDEIMLKITDKKLDVIVNTDTSDKEILLNLKLTSKQLLLLRYEIDYYINK